MTTQMSVAFNAKERVLLGMTLLLAPILLSAIYGVPVMRAQEPAFETNPAMPQYADLLIALAVSAVLVAVRYAATFVLQPLGRLVLSPSKRTNPQRVDRFTSVVFKFTFFVVISIVGYAVMKDEPWFPPELGGAGEIKNAYTLFSTPPKDALKYYFLVQLGYHFHSLVYMLFLSPIRNDFLEMLLHHVATVLLIGGSYLANYIAKGALVCFVHDLGDVAVYAIKSTVDTGNTPVIVVFYFTLIVVWAYTRLYVFPVHVIYNSIFTLPKANPNVSMAFLQPGNVLFCMLQFLHVYWYVLILFMGFKLVSKGVKEDIHEKIEGDAPAPAASVPLANKKKHQ